jgi:hypothetical protein
MVLFGLKGNRLLVAINSVAGLSIFFFGVSISGCFSEYL